MALRSILSILSFALFHSLIAQDCTCSTNLNFAIQQVEKNYSGFADKVNAQTRISYNDLVNNLKAKSMETESPNACYALMQSYRDFFYDNHLWIWQTGSQPVEKPSAVYEVDKIEVDLNKFKNDLEGAICLHPLEGIWESENYTVGILKDKSNCQSFKAFIITAKSKTWLPFEVKMELVEKEKDMIAITYYMGDKSPQEAEGKIVQNIMDMAWLGIWKRTFPITTDTVDIALYQKNNSANGPSIYFEDSNTVVVKIPSFGIDHKPALDSLLALHHERIIKTPLMILDIQGNGGGWNRTYAEVMKYIYSGPIAMPGHSFYATAENIQKQRDIYASNAQYLSDEDKKEWEESFAEYESKLNTLAHYDGDTMVMDEILPYPKQVAVLINERVGSSGEHFVLAAQQCKKVTTFGQNTAGVIDYGDVRPHVFQCDYYGMNIPTTRFDWVETKPIDLTGISPQVYVSKGTKSYIDFVKGYFAKEKN